MKKKTFEIGVLIVLLIVLIIPSYDFIYLSDKSKSLNVGKQIISFKEDQTSAQRLEYLQSQLQTVHVDSNFFYTMVKTGVFSSEDKSYCYNMSPGELSQFRSASFDSVVFKTIYPELQANLDKIDKLTGVKKKKIKSKNIAGKTFKSIGDISFCLEDTMKVNESYRALLIVSKDVSDSLIGTIMTLEYPEGAPKTQKDTMILSKRIFASLLPVMGDQFNIVRADFDTVKNIDLEHKDYVTWEWIVTPIKIGESKLVLKLSRVEAPTGDFDKFFPSKIISVHVSAIEKTWSEAIGDFFKQEWKWLLTGLLAIIGWILVFRQNKHRKNNNPSMVQNSNQSTQIET